MLERGQTVVWLTPPEILSVLGPFDLDPCAAPSPRPWITANHHFDGSNYDGLKEPWWGRVWMNPPYTGIEPWLKKMALHQNGLALIFVRSDTKAWQKWVFPYADSALFIKGRITFRRSDGTAAATGTAPSVLISYSEFDTQILRLCEIPGSLQRRA